MAVSASSTGRLPTPLSGFVGRESERSHGAKLLADARLMSLVGPGGSGKTRLAIELAGSTDRRVVFVDLTSLAPDAAVAHAVAEAMGLRAPKGAEALGEVAWWLDVGEPTLLVLDNAEHLVDDVRAFAAEALTAVADLRILVTSRQALGLAGERELTVGPMTDDDAALLFWDRTRAVRPAIPDTRELRDDARALCRRLDNLPLAVELAAARMRASTPAEILPRLDASLDALGEGAAEGPARHRTLRACIETSTADLPPHLSDVLGRCAVFASPFDAAAANAVAGASLTDLEDLVARSLLQTSGGSFQTSFRELESVREYALDALDADRLKAARDGHLAWLCATFSADAYPPVGRRLANALRSDLLPDLRTALDHAVAEAPERGLRLLGASAELWFRISQDECLRRAEALLAAHPGVDEARGFGQLAATWMLIANQRLDDARSTCIEARELLADNPNAAAMSHFFYAVLNFLSGRFEESIASSDRALEAFRRIGDRAGESRAVGARGTALVLARRSAEAIEVMDEALAIAESAHDVWSQGQIQTYAGLAESDLGTDAAARARLFDAVDRFNEIGDISLMGIALGRLAALSVRAQPRLATRAAGSASRRQGAGGRYHPVTMRDLETVRAVALPILGAGAFEEQWRAGERLTFAEAAAQLREASETDRLTPREREVATLVADGLTNASIAARLVLSERTVENHVAHALDKLSLPNRAALASWVSRREGVSR